MERPYFNSIMKEEGEHKDGGKGPTAETFCQWDCYPEALPWQAVIPSQLLQGGQWPVEGRAAPALCSYLSSAEGCCSLSLHLSCSAPHTAASLQSDKTSLLSAKPDPLRGFCHHTVSARSISYIHPMQLSQKMS